MTRTTKFLTVVHDGRAMPLPKLDGFDETRHEEAKVYTVDQAPPILAPDSPRVEPAKPTVQRSAGMMTGTVQGAAAWAAAQVEKTLPRDVWAEFLDVLRRELDLETIELRAWLDAADEPDD